MGPKSIARAHLRLIPGGKSDQVREDGPDDFTDLVDICEHLYEAVAAKNLNAVMEVWSQSRPVTAVFQGEGRVHGWSNVRLGWARLFGEAEAISVTAGGYGTHISGGVAFLQVVEVTALWPHGGGESVQAPIVATMLFLRGESGEWELVHRHASVFGHTAPPEEIVA